MTEPGPNSSDAEELRRLQVRLEAQERENATLKAALQGVEAAFQQQTSWLAHVADAMPTLISYVDAEQTFRFCNKPYELRFGRPLEQIVGRKVHEVMDASTYEARRPFIERALKGERLTYRATFRGSAGVLETRIEHVPQLAPDGRVLGFFALVEDITERARTEAALMESENRFRRIADSAPAPMWVTGLDRTREFANQAYVEFLGVPYDEALKFDWRTIIHPDDAPRIYAEQIEKEASLQPFTLEARYRRADGAWRWIRSQSQPRWGPDGAHAGFIGVASDLTEAHEAEAALRRLNDELERRVEERTADMERLYSEAPVLLLSVDPEGRVVTASDRWLEFMGYERAAVIGRPVVDFMADPGAGDRAMRRLAHLSRTELAGDAEYRMRTASGDLVDVVASSRAVRDAEGRFLRTISALVDVTARKRAEEQLRQAQKMEAVGQLTGGVAHDFNNLLTPVIGSLDLLRRKLADDPRSVRLLEGAAHAADRAATLVQRLLAFARRQELRPEPTDVALLVDNLMALLERSVGPGVRVEVAASADAPPAMVDANQLELALLNLAVNARDAMPGGGRLRIELDRAVSETGAPMVRLAVVDEGVGMDEATLARAVEPFFSTKRLGEGTGLGLSMVHGLAAQSGGRLELHSRPGEGVRAELWLPAAEAPAVEARAEAPAAGTNGAPLSVMLVDDEDLVRAVTAEMLAELGCQVTQARNAEEALARFRSGAIADAVVTDFLMPGMRGSELAAAVRAERPDLPVLVITGYADKAGEIDAYDRLNKPFRKADLEAWIVRARR